jgi:hypothetical protein
LAGSTSSNQRPNILMQDRKPTDRSKYLLRRTAGPYIGSGAAVAECQGYCGFTPDDGGGSRPSRWTDRCHFRNFGGRLGRLSILAMARPFSPRWGSNDKLRVELDRGVNGICDEALGLDVFHGLVGKCDFGFALESYARTHRNFGDAVPALDVLE